GGGGPAVAVGWFVVGLLPAFEPPVLRSEVAVPGPDRGTGSFDQRVIQPWIALAGMRVATFPAALVVARTDLSPRRQVTMARPDVHVYAQLGDDALRGPAGYARNLIE